MKSIEKLQSALDSLMQEFSNSKNNVAKDAIIAIHEFIIDNTPVKKSELSVWEFVSNDKLRPNMMTVFHDNDWKAAVATDAHVLFVNPKEYIDSTDAEEANGQKFDYDGYTGLMRDKYGKVVERDNGMFGDRYPNYRAVIPAEDRQMPFEVRSDLKQCRDIVKSTLKLRTGKSRSESNAQICINKDLNIWIGEKYVDIFIRAGIDGWTCSNKNPSGRALVKRFADGRILLMMPMLVERKAWDCQNPEYGIDLVNMVKFYV